MPAHDDQGRSLRECRRKDHRHLIVVLPRMKIDHVVLREELGHTRVSKDAEVRPRGRIRRSRDREWPATRSTLPSRSSQSWASWLNSRIEPYFRYENDASRLEQTPPETVELLRAWFSAKLTLASPAIIPALANSVISVGNKLPVGFVSRSYQPNPGISPNSAANPATFVDSARSAEAAIKRGRPASRRAMELTYEPQTPSAARFGACSPGAFHSSAELVVLEIEDARGSVVRAPRLACGSLRPASMEFRNALRQSPSGDRTQPVHQRLVIPEHAHHDAQVGRLLLPRIAASGRLAQDCRRRRTRLRNGP